MKKLLLALALCLLAAPASAAGFSDWAVLIAAGDDHAHSGAKSQVFDNARRDLAKAFAAIGFSPQNMVQFSVDPGPDADQTNVQNIANGLWDVTNRAPGGCLIYFTSHGQYNAGIVTNDAMLGPE